MNGEANGTMDGLMDTSAPNSPDNVQDHKNVGPEGCDDSINHCENSNNTENSNHLDGESIQDPLADSNAEQADMFPADNIDGLSEMPPKVPEDEDSSNIFLDSHSINSNESYPDSVNSSHTKSDTLDQHRTDNIDEKSKDGVSEKELTKHSNDENSEEEVDSEEDSSEEEGLEGEPKAEDTVSINSDSEPEGGDDSSQEVHEKNKDSDIIVLENERSHSQNGNSHDSPSPDVIHEIVSDNDDCVVAEEGIDADKSNNKVQLRRSSRAIKKKKYTDDAENEDHESDIEEIATITPIGRKSKPIVINDTKALVEMASKQMDSHKSLKKEPTIVIIDTHSLLAEKSTSNKHFGIPTNSSINTQNLYQSIVARGTTVTPVSSKCTVSTQSSQNQQPSILPSLTDDMFVVEAPSFIVPYVYEKPSVKEFREFVDLLGKELDEQKAKAEKELQEKEKKEKENLEKERQEKKERGEEVSGSEEDSASACNSTQASQEGQEKKKKKKEKRKRNEDDDASWDGESSADTDDDVISDEEDKTIILKDKADSIEEIKDVTELTADKMSTAKSDNYFDCSLGKFFINIGLSLVQEYVQTDLLKHQNRKLHREKKSGHSTKVTETSIASLMKNLEFSKENNEPYSFKQKKCEFCSFKSESMLAMAHHLETPHMKNSVYKCNFCTFDTRSPHDILYHMEAEHNISGKLERAPAYHQCANCPFEDNGKGKLARHQIPCAKKFKPEINLAPPIAWEPPAKIPKISKSRNTMMGSYQNAFNRNQMGNNSMGRGAMGAMLPGVSSAYRPRGRSLMPAPSRAAAGLGAPIIRGGVMVRQNAPVLMPSNYPVANNSKSKSAHQPSISITPLPRQPQPVQPHPQPTSQNKSTFVICEICDGYIKDLEQLRNHMQWIHKVKIHPKMIYNRPPLNCQKCQFRFFTDQGLERHLLGSHGLVTSSMQEAANKGKDAGRCPVCGRVYQWKLLNHVARDHNLTLKPAHLSYKCTVCTATFGMYKQFENHVYSAHSVVAKRVMDKSKTSAPPPKPANDSLLKPLKINDEITIIPQSVKSAAPSTKNK